MMFPGRYGSSPIASTSLTLKYRVFVNKVDSVPPYTIWIRSPVGLILYKDHLASHFCYLCFMHCKVFK
uniref:Uncharacterized protein n=1 Tax=Gopherus agassizii TaxID=38772 RepID=A0A452J0V1_9SAUR